MDAQNSFGTKFDRLNEELADRNVNVSENLPKTLLPFYNALSMTIGVGGVLLWNVAALFTAMLVGRFSLCDWLVCAHGSWMGEKMHTESIWLDRI